MSEQTEMAPEKRTQGPQTYVVSMYEYIETAGESDEGFTDGKGAWVDIATVTVPPRTPRRKVVKLGLAEAGITPNADGSKPRIRALDVDSAEVHEPEAHQPPPEWRL